MPFVRTNAVNDQHVTVSAYDAFAYASVVLVNQPLDYSYTQANLAIDGHVSHALETVQSTTDKMLPCVS